MTSLTNLRSGVSLTLLREILQSHGGRGSIRDMTSEQFTNTCIKPITTSSSYCDLLEQTKPQHVQKATIFISHAWRYKFLDVFDALMEYFEDQHIDFDKEFIWFDLFSNNQHTTATLDFEWWSSTFRSVIENVNYTLLVLAPWDDPIPLTRCWCLFEIFTTTLVGKRLEIAMGHKEKVSFVNSMKGNQKAEEVLNDLFSRIDVGKSVASIPSDKELIIHLILDSGTTLDELNSIVFDEIRLWILSAVEDVLKTESEESEKAELLSVGGLIYRHQGIYDKAEKFYSRSYSMKVQIFGKDNDSTLETLNDWAYLDYVCERVDAGFHKALDCWELRCAKFGRFHEDTLNTLNIYGIFLLLKGENKKAFDAFSECLEGRRKLGYNEVDTEISRPKNNLAAAYLNHWRFSKDPEFNCFLSEYVDFTRANDMFIECYEAKRSSERFGPNHLETLSSVNSYAVSLLWREEKEKAITELERCLKLKRTLLGVHHPDTKLSEELLTLIHRNAWREWTHNLMEGAPNINRIFMTNNFIQGLLLQEAADYQRSLDFLFKALHDQLSDIHRIECLFAIGFSLMKIRDYASAERYYFDVYLFYFSRNDAIHGDCNKILKYLACLYRVQNLLQSEDARDLPPPHINLEASEYIVSLRGLIYIAQVCLKEGFISQVGSLLEIIAEAV